MGDGKAKAKLQHSNQVSLIYELVLVGGASVYVSLLDFFGAVFFNARPDLLTSSKSGELFNDVAQIGLEAL